MPPSHQDMHVIPVAKLLRITSRLKIDPLFTAEWRLTHYLQPKMTTDVAEDSQCDQPQSQNRSVSNSNRLHDVICQLFFIKLENIS